VAQSCFWAIKEVDYFFPSVLHFELEFVHDARNMWLAVRTDRHSLPTAHLCGAHSGPPQYPYYIRSI